MLYQVMGNCVRTSLSGEENNDGRMIKVIAGRGGINYMGGGMKKYLCCRVEGLISKLDVREGMDLQLGSNVAPYRLSSGTAADLLSKIGSNSYTPASMQRCRPTLESNTEALIEKMRLTAAAKCSGDECGEEAPNHGQMGCLSAGLSYNCSWKPSLESISEIPHMPNSRWQQRHLKMYLRPTRDVKMGRKLFLKP
eukprot:Gb_08335 [translate_table: standard]